jgi:hypothetical protein
MDEWLMLLLLVVLCVAPLLFAVGLLFRDLPQESPWAGDGFAQFRPNLPSAIRKLAAGLGIVAAEARALLLRPFLSKDKQ